VQDGWIVVGRLKRTRGNRGELIGEIYSSLPGREQKLKEVRIEAGGRHRLVEVERIWHHDGRPVFKFAGIDSISEAELWQGADVLVPEAERAAPREGEYSHAELTGCRVVAVETGKTIGEVRALEDYGGPSLLKVEAADGREILIPFTRSICREIDVAAKVIRVELPEGLTEL
jgi:16S rRNA processing protein RimM